jgi:hypothetical protein
MMDIKLGKAMAPDSEVERRQEGASDPSVAMVSSQSSTRPPLACARSIPRNRDETINSPLDLPVRTRSCHWQSDRLTRDQVKDMRAAAEFAYESGHPLNLSIDINWTRTWVGNDPDGRILGHLMELIRKWLKPRYCKVFALIAVRENPDGCPNTHILVHCPPAVLRNFERQVLTVLDADCHGLDDCAVKFKRLGKGNSTLKATLGKLAYMCKGMDPKDAKEFGISCAPQGRINGKRASISQGIHRAARQRYVEGAEG